ncbi:gamma-glutamyl-gamma-aminobutyrate hydrolase family protein [uncultured Zoogloea sp.]|uniref:gamma-glutamyl-gamma-aminobutyrate hydrolase family protein n=1 Tax=uncultured Zoogloea sp. TaxID=160237 RepID=UPI00263807E8|nr:type 1 glutamine amidotransferase [uncultured Zoogloea sp.]
MARNATIRIGLSARLFHPQDGATGLQSKTLQVLEQSIAHWVMSRNVLVLMVPSILKDGPIHRSDIRLRDYADFLDGLVLQGGADVSPEAYGEQPLRADWAGDRVRDAYEMELLHEFVEAGKPVLGICRGMQLINVAFGGSLHQDIPTQFGAGVMHQADAYDMHSHGVVFTEGGQFARWFGSPGGGEVVSIHHQCVRALGRDLVVEATAPEDGMIEAIRHTGHRFVVGVQWHPEFHAAGATRLLDCAPLLDAFHQAARNAR